MSRRGQIIECPGGKWTLLNQGSYIAVGRNYTLESFSPTVSFQWRWRGSNIPFQRKGRSDSDGVATMRLGTSGVWRLKAKPESDTLIRVIIDE